MSTHKRAIIFDLEGTLSNCNHRIHYLELKLYELWNIGLSTDETNEKIVADLKRAKQYGIYVIILSAKPAHYLSFASAWLQAKKIRYDKLILKKDSTPSVVWKMKKALELKKEFDIISAYDDRRDICRMYHSIGIKSIIVDKEGESLCFKPTAKKVRNPEASTKKESVWNILTDLGELFKTKDKEYGSAYKRHGKIMAELFPDGITLKTADDFYFWHIIDLVVVKINRIATGRARSEDHIDSWKDLAVYSAMYLEKLNNKGENNV